MSKIAEMIRKYRILNNLKQEELATMLGRSKSVISNWERGDNAPDTDMIEKLCEIFKITPNEIYGWEPNTIAAHSAHNLSKEEQEKVKEYIAFLESSRK